MRGKNKYSLQNYEMILAGILVKRSTNELDRDGAGLIHIKICVHVKILNLCMAAFMLSRSPYKIFHHFSMCRITVIIESLVYIP
jgi:hypothetical protein